MDAVSLIMYVIFVVLASVVGYYISLKIIAKIVHVDPTTKPVKPDESINKPRVRLLQLDAYLRPLLFRGFKNEFTKERAEAIVNVCSKYDVVSINEAHSSFGNDIKGFVKKMRSAGFEYSVGIPLGDFTSLEIADSGTILFSKLPILDSGNIIFQLSAGLDMLITKGAAYAKIQTTPTSHIHVVATNLQSLSDNSIPECQSVRMNQFREIIRLLDRKVHDDFPVFILGNFNIDARDESVVRRMKHNQYERMFNTIKFQDREVTDMLFESTGEHTPTYGAGERHLIDRRDVGKNMCNDYILSLTKANAPYGISGHITNIVKLECNEKNYGFLSPHFGVESEVALEEIVNA